MGKGDSYRPVDKEKYDKNYLRIYGEPCPECFGQERTAIGCKRCNGIGYIEKRIRNENL